MEGRSQTAYMSEEARLQAQRRMLAEKYGLHDTDSDDSDDGQVNDHRSGPLNEVQETDLNPPPYAENPALGGSKAADNQSLGKNVSATPGEGSKSAETVETERISMGMNYESTEVQSNAGNRNLKFPNHNDDQSSSEEENVSNQLWPGVVLADPSTARNLPAVYTYDVKSESEATARRECRVNQITHYHSMYEETRGRKIAVDAALICYVVGGHIRVLARGSTQRTLLKGHESGVCDVEFATLSSKSSDSNEVKDKDGEDLIKSRHTAVLGSVGEDGSVFIWKIMREDRAVEVGSSSYEENNDENTAATTTSLQVADTLHLEHPNAGRWYQTIAFRPIDGVILSEKGMGIALLLLDTSASDLRVTEQVKMDGKSMVLDKVLKGGHNSKDGDGLTCATWIDKERVATARGYEVCIWSVPDQKCMQRLPRSDTSTKVSSIHVLHRGGGFAILLVAVKQGRELETWSIMEGKEPVAVQRLKLYPDRVEEVFNIVSHDIMLSDFVVISNLRGKSMFILHYREDRACFDAITEIPVKQSVISLSSSRQHSGMKVDRFSENSTTDDDFEIALYCVQPRCIQMFCVPVADCRPRRNLVGPKVLKIESAVDEKAIPCDTGPALENAPPDSNISDIVNLAAPPARGQGIHHGLHTDNDIKGSPNPSQDDQNLATARVAGEQSSNNPGTSEIPVVAVDGAAPGIGQKSELPSSPGTPTDTDRSVAGAAALTDDSLTTMRDVCTFDGTSGTSATEATTFDSTKVAEARDLSEESRAQKAEKHQHSNLSPTDIDEIVAAVIAAANKVTADFDEEGSKRANVDMAKVDRLIASVRGTAESSMEQYVSAALKKPMTDAIIPAVSEIIANASASVDAASAAVQAATASADAAATRAMKMTPEWFGDSFRSAKLASSFDNACKEMSRQASTAVRTSMSQKYECLVQPSVASVQTAVSDLKDSTNGFAKHVRTIIARAEIEDKKAQQHSSPGVNVRDIISSHLTANDTIKAFSVAVKSGNPDHVVWLCSQFEAGTFFEAHELPQDIALSLARQLAENVTTDTNLKVTWLHELMLILEPADSDIAADAESTLRQILQTIEVLRRDEESMSNCPGLHKKSKMLSLLITSLLD